MDPTSAVKQFIDLVNGLGSNVNRKNVTPATAVKFLFARKFDVQRAVALYEQHELIRQRECLYNLDPMSDPLRTELETGKFTILPGRDVSGAAIALFTANLHSPLSVTHKTTLQGVVYQLDIALQNVETQSKGLIFIYDMSSSKYSYFDYDLSQKILTLLKGGYPARLKKVLIVTAPLWFKAPFKILRLFVREKLRERVFTVSVPQLSLHVPRESLPIHLGGSLRINHSTWLAHCHKSMTNREDELLANIGQPTGPQVSTEYVCEQNNQQQQQQQQLNNHQDGSQLSELWSENPPSSASSGFSDDDSLAGAEGDPKTIEQIVDMVRARGRQGLVQEYAEIRARAPEGTFTNARIRVNLAKNRYTDVLCYDHSRVILSQIDDVGTSDYINANFVDGYKQKNAYISTQGPLPSTQPDFWRMVWEQHCLVIVMTTRVLERGRTKCGQYWETDEGGEWEHGNFRVRTISVDSNENYTVSTLELTNLKTDESRMVSHWQFTSWPDYGVPSSAIAMLNFLQRCREQQAKMVKELGDTWAGHPRGPPLVVHCSAGIGRTGTFITLDICISRLEDVGTADIRGTVEKIRSQRAYSIQMPDQYVFCHLAFIEYALSRGMLQSADLSGFDEREEDSEAPLWFKAPFKILRLFVREKLRERVFTVSVPQLSLHVPRESLPIHLGGSLKINHSTWLAHCHKSMTNREDELLANIGQPTGPQVSTEYVCEQNNQQQQQQQQLNNHQDGSQLSELWSENPPSSASSGFSDDDSLSGAEGDPKTIEQIVDMVRARGRQGLVQEYAEIRARAPEGTFTNARIRVNLAKNRYTDVLCYDHSRVILSQIDDVGTSDYINANFVDGYKQKNAYISTQGPLPSTQPDFWRMVWEQHCLVIVMTTRVLERGRTKCGQYWETDEGGEWEHGNFRVRTISVDSNENYTVSTLELTNLKTDESRMVSHWQFTSWPDYGVPSSAIAMLNFLQRCREQQAKMVKELGDTWAGHPRGPPLVVHCSAGIGRTGTFITLDICISRLEDVGTADIRGTVEKIRSQRAYSIQMPDQYVFCHLAFIEYALSRGMLQSADLSGFDEREEDSE